MLNISKILLLFFVMLISFWCGKASANNIKKYTKPSIMIDLDGVLDNYTYYDEKSIPDIKNGAKEFIEILYPNYTLILFTTRNKKHAKKWLKDNNIDKFFADVTNIKYPAKIYLDDRAIQFNGDYKKTLEEINDFKPYWKK